ncbi:hypothetical protein KSS87_012152 [Heliosperma pusillum]|nr:hypothetical protein KSS87_012152 [Heliosperma pusillum]
MEFWNKAKSLAEEAAKKSQELTKEAAKKSQELTSSFVTTSRIADIVSETAKRSKDLAAEASIQIKAEALKRADQIKSLSLLDNSVVSLDNTADTVSFEELNSFGVTEELRDFVQSITFNTFKDFPLPVIDIDG